MRRPVIAVVGGGQKTAPRGSATYEAAEELGRLIAKAGAILLCGGGGGVMEASAIAARNAGGHTVGIMPSAKPPNSGIEYAVYTGMGDGRNFLNAAVSDVIIAMKGEAGTLSEVALAIKLGAPVIYLSAWGFLNDNGFPRMPYVTNPQAAIDAAYEQLRIQPGEKIDRPLKQPSVPNQEENLTNLTRVIAGW